MQRLRCNRGFEVLGSARWLLGLGKMNVYIFQDVLHSFGILSRDGGSVACLCAMDFPPFSVHPCCSAAHHHSFLRRGV